MKTHFVRELEPNQVVTSFFLVHNKQLRQNRAGRQYLRLTLGDRTGVLDAHMEIVPDEADLIERHDFVEVKGLVHVYRNRPQLIVHKLRRLPQAQVDFADYFPHTDKDAEELWSRLRAAVTEMGNPHLRALLAAFLDDPEVAQRLRRAPAAKSLHHATIGGLLEHIVSLVGLCRLCADHYSFLDRDLLVAGAVLHDIGKIHELQYERPPFSYTTAGQLLGHMAILLDLLRTKAAALPGFPPRLKTLVEHMVLSHHGQLEFGSPKLPMFAEAVVLHHLDNLDSKVESLRATLAADSAIEGEWTGFNAALDRPLLKKDKYLAGPEPAAREDRQDQ